MNKVLEAIHAYPIPQIDLRNREIFIENLLFLHALIVASEPLLEEALKRPMAVGLKHFYEKHLEEERGHAKWLKEDLLSLGIKTRDIDWRAAQIAGTQYYLIRHVSPELLLGYMASLECRPMPIEVVDLLERIHGEQALRTIRYHAVHDIDHGADVLKAIEETNNEQLIAYNAGLVASMMSWAIGDCRKADRA